MKYLLSILLISVNLMSWGQTSAVDKLFDRYAEKDGFTTVYITQYMFSMFKDVKTDDKDFDNLVKSLKSIRILAVDNENPPKGVNFFSEIMKDLPVKEYKELMIIKEKGQDVRFMVREYQGKIIELLLIAGGKDNTLISIQGNIDLKNIAQLSKTMKIQGMEQLGKMQDKKPATTPGANK
ncbi:MAG: DUF4252 domain-containing protein [Bacteroidetes bacterium]|nr:DUF4252 domain-containing protein [Bacteroidota bacterium]